MGKYLTHEAVAEGVFNDDFCSATSSLVAWQADLLNSPQVLHLLCDRLSNDFLATPVKFRKPWNFQQVEPWNIFQSTHTRPYPNSTHVLMLSGTDLAR